jgi:hypothetical protein
VLEINLILDAKQFFNSVCQIRRLFEPRRFFINAQTNINLSPEAFSRRLTYFDKDYSDIFVQTFSLRKLINSFSGIGSSFTKNRALAGKFPSDK